jgi:hypothetical protein
VSLSFFSWFLLSCTLFLIFNIKFSIIASITFC